jgi:hypothetical protein
MANNLLDKTNEGTVLSEKSIKIGNAHYFGEFDKWAGVKKVSDSNKAGLQLLYPNLDFAYIMGSFDDYSLKGKDTRKLDIGFWNFAQHLNTHNQIAKDSINKLGGEFKEKTQDLDNLIFENLNRGVNWIFTKAARNFLNEYDKQSISRNHDWIINYGGEIMNFFQGFDTPPYDFFPTNKKVTQTSLTSSIKRLIDEYSPNEVQVLKNSVVCDNFVKKNEGKDEKLKEIFLQEGIMEDGMQHVAYPVRPDSRKNLEEAVYNTKVLEHITGKKHKLIIPLGPSNDNQKAYVKDIEKFAKAHNVSISIGKAFKYLDDINFNVGNFYHICDLAVTTAIMGGFEYSYPESQISGIPLIGRNIREVVEDYLANGMRFIDPLTKEASLYDNSHLMAEKDYHQRLARLNGILKDPETFKASVKKLDLEMRVDFAKRNLNHNANVVRNVYGHDVVAKDLAIILKLPNYKKLQHVAE